LAQAFFTAWNGVICFSAKPDNIVLWAHYASQHRGFVLEFDQSHRFFSASSFGEFREVDYPDTQARPRADDPDKLKTVSTKGIGWKDEKEFRLILPRKELKLGRRLDGIPGHYVDLPIEAIKAIYFGCRIASERRIQLLELLQQPKLRDIQPFQMLPHLSDYRLDPGRWSDSTVKEKANFFSYLECCAKAALNSPDPVTSLKAIGTDLLANRFKS